VNCEELRSDLVSEHAFFYYKKILISTEIYGFFILNSHLTQLADIFMLFKLIKCFSSLCDLSCYTCFVFFTGMISCPRDSN
jgi:hypothetical protein